ncbi:unnamed protein product [Dracunculus medinensis]|uniref:BTB domain-containing protein n=1 Tax=Dracunculus medinensis TaxID=318479 RepID=A0A0N4U5R5_DRAME|nr:unnamed protein product [Dracunculus medinensis]
MKSDDQVDMIKFNYVWTTRVFVRNLSPTETVILQVSPKFATVYDGLSFQWSLKMHGSTYLKALNEELDTLSYDEADRVYNAIALSLYFNDGPVPVVDLCATVNVVNERCNSDDEFSKNFINDGKSITMQRGRETELSVSDRASFSQYIKANIGRVVRFALFLDMPAKLFNPESYLNTHTPTPYISFLTANYRARASSKVFRRKSRKYAIPSILCQKLFSQTRSNQNRICKFSSCKTEIFMQNKKLNWSKSLPNDSDHNGTISESQKNDYIAIFNRVMEQEREQLEQYRECENHEEMKHENECECDELGIGLHAGLANSHLFKKLLIACCEGCEKRASLTISEKEESDDSDDENAFECAEENKEKIHDLLANMYFNKIVLPEMEFVEDFADFLIDAELNDLPVLKRACERYLCGELNNKKDLITSLLLDLLFLAIVFNLPVMKSMTLAELSSRTDELVNVEELLKQDEYR